jgi:methyl-accepting chemotaxis protein
MTSIKTKLYRGILLVALLMLGTGIGSLFMARAFSDDALELVNRTVTAGTELSSVAVEAQKIRRFEKEYFIYVQDAQARNKYTTEFDKSANQITELLTRMGNNRNKIYTEKEVERIRSWQQAADFYFDQFRRIAHRVNSGEETNPATANAAIRVGKDRFAVLLEQVSREVEERKAVVNNGRAEIMSQMQWAGLAMFVLAILAVCACMWQFLQLYGFITAPIERIVDAAEELAAGRVPQRLENESAAEFSRIMDALETVRTRMLAARAV